MKQKHQGIQGAVLLELLLSMTLFLVVLLPLTRFLIRTAGTDRAADIVLAGHMAKEYMASLRQDPENIPTPKPKTMNDRLFRIIPNVNEQAPHLYKLTVQVYRGSEQHPLVSLTTHVFAEEEP